MGQGDVVRAAERFFDCVQRAGADVAEHYTDCADCQTEQSASGGIGMAVARVERSGVCSGSLRGFHYGFLDAAQNLTTL